MHLWGVTEERLIARHRLYRITERLRWPSKPVAEIERTYSFATDHGDPWRFNRTPDAWWAPYRERGWMQYLDLEREPWQNAEADRLIAEHGVELFKGLRVRREDFK
jgi:hypothetical protein